MNYDDLALVQIRLPKALVKRLDHLRIDQSRTRQALIQQILVEWLAAEHQAGPAPEGRVG